MGQRPTLAAPDLIDLRIKRRSAENAKSPFPVALPGRARETTCGTPRQQQRRLLPWKFMDCRFQPRTCCPRELPVPWRLAVPAAILHVDSTQCWIPTRSDIEPISVPCLLARAPCEMQCRTIAVARPRAARGGPRQSSGRSTDQVPFRRLSL